MTSSRRFGFTFVEALLALLITGLVMTALYGILLSTVRVKEMVEKDLDEVKAGTLAFDLLRRDLQCACRYPDGEVFFQSDPGDGFTYGGGAGRLDFIAAVRNRFPDDSAVKPSGEEEEGAFELRTDLCEIGYYVKETDGGKVLVRREDFHVDDDPGKGGVQMKLIRDVKSFELQFYTGLETESGEDPALEWDAEKEERLPYAVKVKLVLEPREAGAGEEGEERVFEAVVPLLAGERPLDEEEAAAEERRY